ncbi:MAG: 4-hydroxy-tetrahydrodipicolinate reductase [Clostridia bacterium]|nr:4-hydroxy-tetrahydrodipicolinate reductase [Clostridia bacterium]
MGSNPRVLVTGAAGRMGREVVRAVVRAEGMELAGAVDRSLVKQDAGVVAGVGPLGVEIRDDLDGALRDCRPDVMVDFTIARAAQENTMTAIANHVRFVVGTSGLGPEAISDLMNEATKERVAGAIVPNFALGAVLMMRFARAAAKYMPACEIIELHHDGKVDFPSGTSVATAHEVASGRGDAVGARARDSAVRGVEVEGVPIHSVRLPGLVAHQEVIFGGPGQVLTIRHDSMGRDSFMPGVLLAIRRVMLSDMVVLGLDSLMD